MLSKHSHPNDIVLDGVRRVGAEKYVVAGDPEVRQYDIV